MNPDRTIRNLTAAGNQVISSSSDITSKAHRNASEPDDPSAQDPVEGGPKTAETDPEPTTTQEFLTTVDVSTNLDPDQRRQLENILLRNKKAFGLDGRLGNHDAQVEIRMKPGAEPISLPPFSASPLNREVMDKQMDSWINLSVIEPSTSPWGAPAFITYRNNK
ncbi:hypothetical protein BDZ89DRAFT_967226, partial [Hymenopellis radicata]